MRLLYRLVVPSRPFVDVVVEASPDATIGDLADELLRYVGDHASEEMTIAAEDDPAVPGREELVATAAPRSGSVVVIAPATSVVRPRPIAAPVVLSSATRGPPVRLPYGRTTIGTASTCAVVVEAAGVEPVHAEVVVGDSVELHAVGTGSIDVDGTPVRGGIRLGSGSLISIGSELLTLRIDERLRPPPPRGPVRAVARVQSMRPEPTADPIEVPVPPERIRLPGFPVLTATVPLLMGAALWVATRSALTAAFVLFSFVFVVAGGLESRRESRAEQRFRIAEFRRLLAEAARRTNDRADRSVAGLDATSPGPAELLAWAGRPASRLWERWDVGPAVMRVRLGHREQCVAPCERRPGGLPDLRDEADRVMAEAGRRVAPVTIDLDVEQTLAVTGSDESATAVGRSVVVQIATMIGPDVCGIEVHASPDRRPIWRWVEWLPHVEPAPGRGRRLLVVDGLTGTALDEVLAELESDSKACAVVIATSSAHLPRPGAVVATERHDLNGSPIGRLRIGDGGWTDFEPEDVSADEAETAARSLAALRPSVPIGGSTNPSLPGRLALSEILDTALAGDGAAASIASRWRATGASSNLAAPVGVARGGVLSVDLRRDGPHALIAGTTGSGKSELLRTMVAALAANHAPERITFLLIDYKGGAAFRGVSDLPHTVGVITDLTQSLAERALVSLWAELRRREHLLVERGLPDTTDVEAMAAIDRPPALVVMIDEFATLAREIPAFVDGVVDVAQRGRSLGIHLILATQRPAGVVTDAIRANTGLRIALRMADADDSRDVVDNPAAAHLPRDIPGRSVLRVGPHQVLTFQAAYSGGPSSYGPVIQSARLGHTARPTTRVAANPTSETELAALVAAVRGAHRSLGGRAPRRPWLDPLPGLVALSTITSGSSTESDTTGGRRRGTGAAGTLLAIGLADQPHEQRQDPHHIDLSGGVLVVGAGRSGRTTTLRTIATTAARRFGSDIEIHAIDCGRDLESLARIDRVGDVVMIDDVERVMRLLRGIDSDLRRRLIDRGHAPSRRLLIIDGFGAFEAATARVNGGEALDLLARLAIEGRAVDIHVVAAAGRRSEVPPAIYSALGQRIVLRCGTVDDAVMLGVPLDVAESPIRAGLAWCSGVAVQIATADSNEPASGMGSAARSDNHPRPVPRLPTLIRRSALAVRRRPSLWTLPIGLHGDDLATVDLDLAHHAAVVAGPPRSGRSAALTTIADSARAAGIPRRILVSAWHTPSTDHPVWTDRWCLDAADDTGRSHDIDGDGGAHSGSHDEVDDLIVGLARVIDEIATSDDPTLVAFDDIVELFDRTPESGRLDTLVLRLLDLGRRRAVRVVVASEADTLGRCYEDSVRRLRTGRTGILLTPDPDLGGSLLHAALPRRDDLPHAPGRGWLLHPGSATPVQLAVADDPPFSSHP